jgi:DNA-binding protein H-NS
MNELMQVTQNVQITTRFSGQKKLCDFHKIKIKQTKLREEMMRHLYSEAQENKDKRNRDLKNRLNRFETTRKILIKNNINPQKYQKFL